MTKYSEEFKLMVVQEYLSGSIELLEKEKRNNNLQYHKVRAIFSSH